MDPFLGIFKRDDEAPSGSVDSPKHPENNKDEKRSNIDKNSHQ